MITIRASEYRALAAKASRRSKYRNKPVVVDGIRFDSGTEAARYGTLLLMQRAGLISKLSPHPRFELHGKCGGHVGFFTADAEYTVVATGAYICEDTKSPATRKNTAYRLRLKLMWDCHKIRVSEFLA